MCCQRFNKIEKKIEKFLTKNDNNNWFLILPDLMINYNTFTYKSIKKTLFKTIERKY